MSTKRNPIWTKSFINISITNFFVFTTFYALLTMLPIYVLDEMKATPTQAGLVVTIFLLSVIVIRPFCGKIIETFGRRKMLIFSTFLFALLTFLYFFIDHFSLLLLLRFVHGIPFSIASTVTLAIAADTVPQERRGEGLSYFGMSMNLAVVTGPFIALTFIQYVSYQLVFIIFGILMAIGWLCGLNVKGLRKSTQSNKKIHMKLTDLYEKKSLPIASVGLLVAFSYASVLSFISVYAQTLGLVKTASFFFLVFALAMLISRPFTGRLFDTMGANIVIIPSCIIFALGLFSLSFTHTSWMLLASGALIGLGYGTILPCFQALAIESAPRDRSAYATATFFTLYDSGLAIGSFVLGIIAGALGYSELYFILGIFVLLTTLYFKWIMSATVKKRKTLQSIT